QLIKKRQILSAAVVKQGGVAAAITKMSFGNQLGLELEENLFSTDLFLPHHGSLVLEMPAVVNTEEAFGDIPHLVIGKTLEQP
ncbi:MAG TPA: hypothetical protein DEA44_00425, partial [Firmicutes bacterium]|nr:hypothetical protein [Bacillota bacterium]